MSPKDARLLHMKPLAVPETIRLSLETREKLLEHVATLDHATPYFFTSRNILKQNYELFDNLFENADICYALKANSDPKVLLYLDSLGCGFEAASAYEVDLLLQLGVSPQKIIYGTSIKPSEHIRRSFKNGVDRFAADSKEELAKIAVCAPGARVYIRTIVDDKGSVFMMSERFGAPVEQVEELLLYAKSLDLKLYGISFYVGSQAATADKWSNAIAVVQPVIERLYAQGVTLEVLNIGGGFPVPYRNHADAPLLPEIVGNIHNAIHQLPYIPKLVMEPGRGIVATSTVLVTEIVARNDRHGKPWLCLDAGIYNALYEAMIHQGETQYNVGVLNPPLGPVTPMTCMIAGPTGDSLDIVLRDAVLPDYLGVGDKLVFDNTGAYSVTMASRFNGFPAPELYIG